MIHLLRLTLAVVTLLAAAAWLERLDQPQAVWIPAGVDAHRVG